MHASLSECFRYTRVTLQQETEPQTANGLTESGEKAGELDAVERSISNHRDLLRQVTSYPNRKLKQPDFLPYDPADSLTDPIALLPPPEPCPSISTSTSTRRSEHRLKPLEELCNAYFLSLMKEQLADTERRLRGDRSMLRTARVTNSLSKRLTPINFLFELWSPEDGDEEEGGDAAEVELPRTTGTKSCVEAFQSEPMSLESFFSCVEEIPIKLEADEARTVTPDDSVATEMTGSVSSGDSIEVLGTEKSYRSQHVDTGSDSRGTKQPVDYLNFHLNIIIFKLTNFIVFHINTIIIHLMLATYKVRRTTVSKISWNQGFRLNIN